MPRLLCLIFLVGASAIVCRAAGATCPCPSGGMPVSGPASVPPQDSLEVTGLRVTPRGPVPLETLKSIAAQENLESLNLSGCYLRLSDCHWFADLRALRFLSLRNTNIGDVSFACFAELRELEELDLYHTSIT